MIPPAFVVPIICVIYLIGLLITRWKRMTGHESLTAATELFACWGIVFFGLLAAPSDILSLFWRLVFASLDTLIFLIIGLTYFKKQIAVMKPTLSFWVTLTGELFIAVAYSFFATIILRLTFYYDVLIVTYNNVISALFYGIALYYAYDFIRRIKLRQNEKKQAVTQSL